MKIPLRLSFFLVLMPLIANAQAPFRIGAYGGINFSNIMVLNRHSVLQPTPTIVDREAKQYEDWFSLDHMGFQAGLISLIALNDQVFGPHAPLFPTLVPLRYPNPIQRYRLGRPLGNGPTLPTAISIFAAPRHGSMGHFAQ
jgi:hypothetical protein